MRTAWRMIRSRQVGIQLAVVAALLTAPACSSRNPAREGSARVGIIGWYVPDIQYNIHAARQTGQAADLWDAVVAGLLRTELDIRSDGTYVAHTPPFRTDFASYTESGTWTLRGQELQLAYSSGQKHVSQRRLWARGAFLYWPQPGHNDFRSHRSTKSSPRARGE